VGQYIVDRLKDIIIVSGFNIVPREVEEEKKKLAAGQGAAREQMGQAANG
jgi:acyl-CoA synthetase (AMP-forming)/AMP-acid ligase II